jgi:long-chain acyl-CoA synthetase
LIHEAHLLVTGIRYFRTGDLGCLVDKRFLKLTGRVNELYKLENGKFVMPSLVESALGRSNYISQNCVIGANRPFNIALIVPDMVELAAWMKTKNIEIPTDPRDEYKVLHYSEVIALYQSEVPSLLSPLISPLLSVVSLSPLCRLTRSRRLSNSPLHSKAMTKSRNGSS